MNRSGRPTKSKATIEMTTLPSRAQPPTIQPSKRKSTSSDRRRANAASSPEGYTAQGLKADGLRLQSTAERYAQMRGSTPAGLNADGLRLQAIARAFENRPAASFYTPQALKDYLRVLDDNPKDVFALNKAGDLCVRMGRPADAIGHFARIADSYSADGFFLKANAIYKKINKIDPTRLDVYERLEFPAL